jgi:hypothetical protein|tara:strand:+ start:672 stop:1133 length:462 start_codon:yes stop_codon:yes gene_type:complete
MEKQISDVSHAQNAAIDSIIVSATSLTEIIQKETEYLRAADTKSFQALHNQKTERAHAYQEQFMKLVSNKAQLKSANPEALERLQQARSEMITASNENLEALSRTTKSLNRISERILKLARKKSQGNALAYSAKGTVYDNNKTPISVGLTETV